MRSLIASVRRRMSRGRALPMRPCSRAVTRRFTPSLLLALAMTAVVPAKTTDLPSAWRSVDLTIDGSDAEWPGGATLLGEIPIALGVANDGEFVYVRVRTSDRAAAMQILYGGLTVWVDPGGREKKVFGLKYPVGTKLPEPTRRGGSAGGQAGEPTSGRRPLPEAPPGGQDEQGRSPGRPPGQAPDPATVVPPRIEILGPGKDDARSLVLEFLPPGVAVGIARVENTLVYEFKVPLVKSADYPYAVGAAPGARIGIGLETGKVQRPEVPGRPGGMTGGGRSPGGGGPGGMGPGGMGGMGGRGGQGGGRGRGADAGLEGLFKQVKVWARVQLATAP